MDANETVALVNDIVKNDPGSESVEENTVGKDNALFFERDSEASKAFARDIDLWNRAGRPDGESFVLGSTGDVLQGLGAIESDIYMLGDKINEILSDHPEMTLDEIKKIPQILENPILILKSKGVGRGNRQNTRLVIFGSVKAKDNRPVLSVLDLRPQEGNLVIDDMQRVTSAYTKDKNPVDFVRNSDVLYADKNITTRLLKSIGFKMPIELQQSGYIGSISYFKRSVNIEGKSFSEIFKEDSNIRYSERDYSYEALISKPDMVLTTIGGKVPNNRADIVAEAKKNAASVGKMNKDGSVSVYVDDVGTEVVLATNGLLHGLSRIKKAQVNPNFAVTLKAGEIIKNSIKINELLPSKENATESYVLLGVANNTNGDLYIVRSVVNQFNHEQGSMDILYAINAKKEELAATKSPRLTAKPLSVTSSVISIFQLLDFVNDNFPDVLPESVLRHFGHTSRPEGELGESALFSERDTEDADIRCSEREVLDSYGIRSVNKYVAVQKAVIETLTKEGFFSDGNNVVVNKDSEMVVEITKDGSRKTLGNGNRFETLPRKLKVLKLSTIRMLPSLIEQAHLVEDNVLNIHNTENKLKYAYLTTDINVDDGGEQAAYTVSIAVRKSQQKNKFWIHEIRTTKKSNAFLPVRVVTHSRSIIRLLLKKVF